MILIELPRASGMRPFHFTLLTIAITAMTLVYMAYIGARWSGYWRSEVLWMDAPELVSAQVGGQNFLIPPSLMRAQSKFSLLSGRSETNTLQLDALWPSMSGFHQQRAAQSSSRKSNANLILIDITRNDGGETMRDRLDTVYRRLARGPASEGPAGLKVLTLSSPVALKTDQIVYEPGRKNGFIARCRKAADTAATCTREARISKTLAVSYRFKRSLLANWGRLDRRVNDLIKSIAK